VEKEYVFDGPNGKETLADLFCGKSQLIVYHFMFGPGWKEGCPHCSFWAEHYDSVNVHLGQRDTTFAVISRAPWKEIAPFKKRMGWHFKWVSSFRSDFNCDYHASLTPEQRATGKVNYNYTMQEFPSDEAPGASVFYKNPASGEIFHTYSVYARGLDPLFGTYTLLDMVPNGRNEDQLGFSMEWVRHHDRYGTDLFLDPTRPYWPPTASPPVSSASSTCACGLAEAHT
jgi:predicted dithiol-disulfide oxidoreductase (DUF899 family)